MNISIQILLTLAYRFWTHAYFFYMNTSIQILNTSVYILLLNTSIQILNASMFISEHVSSVL